MGKRIAVLGSAPSSAKMAPFNDPTWEIWACSPANLQLQPLPRITIWFEMHSWSLDNKRETNPQYYGWLKHQKKIAMQKRDPDFPGSFAYPIKEVRKRWPWGSRYFLLCSPAEMMAMALLDPAVEAIGLWGIDMQGHSEYEHQRPSIHYWMEKAEERPAEHGGRVAIISPGESDILAPPPVYGYCESTHQWRKLNARKRELEGRIQYQQQIAQKAQQEMLVLKGAHESTIYDMRTWIPHDIDEREQVADAVPAKPELTEEQKAEIIAKTKAKAAKVVEQPLPKRKRNSTIKIGKPALNGKGQKNQAKQQESPEGGPPGSPPCLDGGQSPGGS